MFLADFFQHQLVHLCTYVGVVCETDLPVSLMSTYGNPDIRTYGTVVRYDCLEGYRFRPRVYVSNVTCTEDGSWRPDIGDCEGIKEFKLFSLFVSYIFFPKSTLSSTLPALHYCVWNILPHVHEQKHSAH